MSSLPVSNGRICSSDNNNYYLARQFRENYAAARLLFLESASANPHVKSIDSILIAAKGPADTPLYIDIAVMGELAEATKILFHISGTHGVEGFAGSAIQSNLLGMNFILPKNTAIILLHSLNPYGMAYNRRADEKNIDLNRNFTTNRTSSTLYDQLDPFVNPKMTGPFDQDTWNEHYNQFGGFPALMKQLDETCSGSCAQQLIGGQYDKPAGIFYGGQQESEGPTKVFEWCERTFALHGKNIKDLSICVVDVHTGLGENGTETLLTTAPNEKIQKIFNMKKREEARNATCPYIPKGIFIVMLGEKLRAIVQKIAPCAKICIDTICQEIGTDPIPTVVKALIEENAQFHYVIETGDQYDPDCEGGQTLRECFCPNDDGWKHGTVVLGQKFIENCLVFLSH